MPGPSRLPRAAGAVIALSVSFAAGIAAGEGPDFERDVAPILVKHCLDCHQANKSSGELNLTTRESFVRGGAQGAAFVAGEPDKSLFVERIDDQAALRQLFLDRAVAQYQVAVPPAADRTGAGWLVRVAAKRHYAHTCLLDLH